MIKVSDVAVRIADGASSVARAERPSVLATVAHELRAPISALETAAELLVRDFDQLDDAGRRELVATMHRRTVWLRGLVENLLCDAAIRDGGLRMLPRLIDLRETIEELAVYFGPLLEQRGQRITFTGDSVLPLVPADPNRIAQVLTNLISNSNKYASPTSTIAIGTALAGDVVRVTVSDEGAGLAPTAFGRVFRAYDRAGRRGGDGVGIGLWVVRSIVEAHGGRVGVENRESGGTTFWFELPLMVTDASTARVSGDIRMMARVG